MALNLFKSEGNTGSHKGIPEELGILPLNDLVAYPYMVLPLAVAVPSLMKLIEDAIDGSHLVGLLTSKKPRISEPVPGQLHEVGKMPASQKIKELGEDSGTDDLTAEYEKRRTKAALPEEAHEEGRRELTRLKGMHPSSAEHSVIKTCLDELPQEGRQEMTIRLADRVEEAFAFALQPDGSGAAGSREKMPDLG
jgi:ATP-dependent Lon protease